MIPQDMKQAARCCLACHIPFAIARQGGSNLVRFVASHGFDDQYMFMVSPWCTPLEDTILITGTSSPRDIIEEFSCKSTKEHSDTTLPHTTSRDSYTDAVNQIVDHLKAHGGKTVLSRVIAGKCPGADWVDVAERLFDSAPDDTCYIYYDPECGGWLGATPELLIEGDIDEYDFTTMSLAGTKLPDGEWDEKNREEQQMVTDFIVDNLNRIADTIEVEETTTLHSKNVDHLCTIINAKFNQLNEVADFLSLIPPTPAVSGLPRHEAIELINKYERHRRGCYGGYFTMQAGTEYAAYVNLRCMQFSGDSYAIYTGSGITARSTADDEWNETAAKAQPLLNLLDAR